MASVIAHELAHQWFGNLVTMRWWVDLWLNEGFATYVASLGVQHLHPEWNAFQEESLENTVSVFEFDALKSSHPVSVQIGNPNQIPSIFDRISYDKGVCSQIFFLYKNGTLIQIEFQKLSFLHFIEFFFPFSVDNHSYDAFILGT